MNMMTKGKIRNGSSSALNSALKSDQALMPKSFRSNFHQQKTIRHPNVKRDLMHASYEIHAGGQFPSFAMNFQRFEFGGRFHFSSPKKQKGFVRTFHF